VKRNKREDSDNDPKEDVHSLLEGRCGWTGRGRRGSKKRTDTVENPPPLPSLPLSAMDSSSVRYPPTSVMVSADQTSTRGLPRPRLDPQRSGRFYMLVRSNRLHIGLHI